MELASHGDLLDYIKLFGYLLEDKARYMFQQLVLAIEYLHSLNIIHRLNQKLFSFHFRKIYFRDLKCENILLDSKNNIKLTDS